MNSPNLYFEIGPGSLRVLDGEDGVELPLERTAGGGLTTDCQGKVVAGLRAFLNRRGRPSRRQAICAIGARGVSLRRLTLPAASREELQRLLLLQIESEFPLPPDELAWGSQPAGAQAPRNGGGAKQDILVAAMKKEIVGEYAGIFANCGLSPVFTLAAVARSYAIIQPPGAFAVLDLGRNQSELMCFEEGFPASVRILPWGGESLTRAIRDKLGVSQEEAEKMKLRLDREPVSEGELGAMIQSAVDAALDSLAAVLQPGLSCSKLYLTGKSARNQDLAGRLARRLGGVECERVEMVVGAGRSAAIAGLRKVCERDGGVPPLVIKYSATNGAVRMAQPGAAWKWAAAVVALALACAALPQLEALLLKPVLTRKLAGMKADLSRLRTIDDEAGFLQFLTTNQPPYSDALLVIANSAPQGAKIDSLSMNKRGEVSLRASMGPATQVTDFRTKLISSGFFGSVAVEEQTPTPDGQRMNVRMSALWKPAGAREGLKIPIPASPPKGGMPGQMSFGLPPGMMPEGMPAGFTPAAMPPGVVLPAGVQMPPGVTLPPGVTPPPDAAVFPGVPPGRNGQRGNPTPVQPKEQ